MSSNPMITLNHSVAAAMVNGPESGLRMLEALEDDPRIAQHHRLEAVRGHLLETAGDIEAARAAYRLAARRTASVPERRYLEERASRLTT
jgi:predicted RNA polymerase sigma factor